jgi:4-hydroxy-tetrahydrodipicolinate reductase
LPLILGQTPRQPIMRMALIGYGKMGRLVEAAALREGWDVSPKLDIAGFGDGDAVTPEALAGADVAVEFTQPDAVLQNIETAAQAGINLVVGTTGWTEHRGRVESLARQSGIGLVYAANFSVGVNLFFEIVRHASEVVGRVPQYDPYLAEEHHSAKKDAPSGTAVNLIEIMRPYLGGRTPGVACTRAGKIPGNHIVGFDGEADTIILEHRARSRAGFAEGAVLAARWIVGKKGCYDFRDVFRELIGL